MTGCEAESDLGGSLQIIGFVAKAPIGCSNIHPVMDYGESGGMEGDAGQVCEQNGNRMDCRQKKTSTTS